MTTSEAIDKVDKMNAFQKAMVYKDYFIDMLFSKYTGHYYKSYGTGNWKVKSYYEFCDKSNVQINESGCEDWQKRGFASKSWIVFRPESIYYSVYHSQK